MPTEQQRDNIEVEVVSRPDTATEAGFTEHGGTDVVITDRRAGRAWSGEGKTASEAATQAVRRLLGDRRAREYV